MYILENVEIEPEPEATKYYVLKIWVEETGYSRKTNIPLSRQIISNEILVTKETTFATTS